MKQGHGLNLSFYQLVVLFFSLKIIGCGYINVAVGPNTPIQALDDQINLKINYGQSGAGANSNSNSPSTPIAVTEGNQLVVSISLTSKLDFESSFQISLEGSRDISKCCG